MRASQEVSSLLDRAEAKRLELADVERELHSLVGHLVDSTNGDRAPLLARRAELVVLRDVLGDERLELIRRAQTAHVAAAELAERQALVTYEEQQRRSREARMRLDEALVARRAFVNRGRSKLSRAAGDAEAVRLAAEVGTLTETSGQLARDLGKAQAALDGARAALATAKREAAGMGAP
jgi:hypothetical protein